MKTCIVTGIFPPDIGGPATYVKRFAYALHQKAYPVRVVTLTPLDGTFSDPLPFRVKRVSRSLPLPLRLVGVFIALLCEGWNCDVWYINGLELPAVLAGKLLRKRLVMKIVSDYAWERAGNQGLTSDNVHEFQCKRQHWKVELHKTLRAWLARLVDMVITPSGHVGNLVRGWHVPEERIQTIYNAVEVLPERLDTKEEAREQLELPEAAAIIVTVGRLIPLKRIDRLIQAIDALNAMEEFQQPVMLLVVGDGPEKNRLTELSAMLNVAELVHFTGQLSRDGVLRALRAADLFVLNSSIEGFSHVLLESMMVGTPVIATAVGGNPELIAHGENGVLIASGNDEELITQLRRMLSEPQLRITLSENGRQTAARYSWDTLLQDTLCVLGCAA
ncbi:hypothetical protein CSA56_16755 [candidate division KSB3 bacterium]|uniref:Glycosyl transferase family 1 n=1 Tax=candidate division KSB3 bacterium TaxID=2044937 RepID=A0A2G6K8L4_9BACT|nr:MAG: hypothetical protein CSA56_16755 [candidate division KSB3 bacterium]